MVSTKAVRVKNGASNGVSEEEKSNGTPKIMTKPLPQILDELESYIERVEEAVRQARTAAKESREAAAQAKEAGEKAAAAASAKAEAAVTRDLVKKIISSWEFLLLIGVVIVGSVYASIAISVGIGLFR